MVAMAGARRVPDQLKTRLGTNGDKRESARDIAKKPLGVNTFVDINHSSDIQIWCNDLGE
jgi:hypothetical protein